MNSSRLAAWLARRNVHCGWVVVGTTFLTMLVTAGPVSQRRRIDRHLAVGNCHSAAVA